MSTPDGSKPQPLAPQQAHSQQSVPPQPYPQQQLQQYGVQPYAPQAPYPQQYGVQPYAQPYAPVYPAPYPYPASPPKGLSISSMVIGLVSLFFGFTFVLPVVGFVLGLMGLRREPAGRAMAITGVVLNGLFLLVWAALVLLWVFVIGGLLAGVGGAASTGIAA
jgi:MFS family permease